MLSVAFYRAVAVETDALTCLRTAGIVMVRADVEENILRLVAETDKAVAFGIIPCGNRTAHDLIGRQQILLGGFRSGITGFGDQRLLDFDFNFRTVFRTEKVYGLTLRFLGGRSVYRFRLGFGLRRTADNGIDQQPLSVGMTAQRALKTITPPEAYGFGRQETVPAQTQAALRLKHPFHNHHSSTNV